MTTRHHASHIACRSTVRPCADLTVSFSSCHHHRRPHFFLCMPQPPSVLVSAPPPNSITSISSSTSRLVLTLLDSPASAQHSTCPGLDISLFALHLLLLLLSFFCFSAAYSYLLFGNCRIGVLSFLTSMSAIFTTALTPWCVSECVGSS
jgi:hypothetical protein